MNLPLGKLSETALELRNKDRRKARLNFSRKTNRLDNIKDTSHVNQHLRKIGHLTVPRCLAGGGGIALICVDTYIFFTAVLNISLIGG